MLEKNFSGRAEVVARHPKGASLKLQLQDLKDAARANSLFRELSLDKRPPELPTMNGPWRFTDRYVVSGETLMHPADHDIADLYPLAVALSHVL